MRLGEGLIVWAWQGFGLETISIGSSVLLVLSVACLLGLSVPALLRTLKLDLKIAEGPLILAITDIFTILCYFGLAAILL